MTKSSRCRFFSIICAICIFSWLRRSMRLGDVWSLDGWVGIWWCHICAVKCCTSFHAELTLLLRQIRQVEHDQGFTSLSPLRLKHMGNIPIYINHSNYGVTLWCTVSTEQIEHSLHENWNTSQPEKRRITKEDQGSCLSQALPVLPFQTWLPTAEKQNHAPFGWSCD